jgi:hypothetical protein
MQFRSEVLDRWMLIACLLQMSLQKPNATTEPHSDRITIGLLSPHALQTGRPERRQPEEAPPVTLPVLERRQNV